MKMSCRCVGLAQLLCCTGAIAQVNTKADDRPLPMELIEVTGYHVSRADYDGPVPVDVFDEAALQASGVSTVSDFLRTITYNAPLQDYFAGFSQSPGKQRVNLRSLGSDATLVLINGRRMAATPERVEGAFYDINTIPFSTIERIEIVKDGASAIYGADAVAGVVNIITRQDHTGIDLEVGYSSSTENDGEETDLVLNFGHSWQRATIAGHASYYDRDPQYARDRSFTDSADLRNRHGRDNRSPSSSPPTMYTTGGSDGFGSFADPACPVAGNPAEMQDEGGGYSTCRYNYNHDISLISETTRWSVGLNSTLELSEQLSLYLEGGYTENENNPVQPPSFLGGYFVPAEHPGNPLGQDSYINYRITELGNRRPDFETDDTRFVASLDGGLGEWEWNLAYSYNRQKDKRKTSNAVLADEFQAALEGFGGPDGDQYYDPFGLDPHNPQEVIEGFTTDLKAGGESKLQTYDVSLRRLFSPGPLTDVAIALGAQYREEEMDSYGSNGVDGTAGRPWGDFLGPGANGDRDVSAVYIEFGVPIGEALEFQLAGRYEDYSDFGSEASPKLGLAWRPAKSLLIRATWSESFTPPSLGETTDTGTSYSIGWIDDDRCAATGNNLDCQPQLIEGRLGGDPDLGAETGDSWLLGIEYSPDALPGFRINAEYWSFKYEDQIEVIPFEYAYDYLKDDPFWVERGPNLPSDPPGAPGPLLALRSGPINLDTTETSGVDAGASYDFYTDGLGSFSLSMTHTYLNEWKITDAGDEEGFPLLDKNLAGSINEFGLMPEWRSTYQVNWQLGRHGLVTTVHYVDGYRSNVERYDAGVPSGRPYDIDSFTSVDLRYNLAIPGLEAATLSLGCRNCTDEDPPQYNNTLGWEAVHDGQGAILYARWSQSF